MICPKCGTEFEGNFCPECEREARAQAKNNAQNVILGVLITIIICGIIALIIIFSFFPQGEDNTKNYSFINFNHNFSEITIADSPSVITIDLPEATNEKKTDFQKEYDYAYSLWRNDKFSNAAESFNKILIEAPEDCIADDALAMIGKCCDSLKLYDDALNAYASVILDYPQSNKLSSCYYQIGYILKYEKSNSPEAKKYIAESLKHLNDLDDSYKSAIKTMKSSYPDVSIKFSFKYKILDQTKLFEGGQYGDVLIESINPKTNKDTIKLIAQLISCYENFSEESLYCTEEAFKANFSESYLKQNPNALKNGFVCSIGKYGIQYNTYN